jgi:mono/diheme cytochrome c family protein
MKKLFIVILIGGLLLYGCVDSKKEVKQLESDVVLANLTENEGLKLLEQNCYACHSVTSESHDAIIAPPMVAVVRRYKMMYQDKESFVNGISNWVLNPTADHALMRGAVSQFNVMPKLPFNKNEVLTIAQYIYDNELEAPSWFEDHFNSQHPNGMGMGMGNGRGRQQ